MKHDIIAIIILKYKLTYFRNKAILRRMMKKRSKLYTCLWIHVKLSLNDEKLKKTHALTQKCSVDHLQDVHFRNKRLLNTHLTAYFSIVCLN